MSVYKTVLKPTLKSKDVADCIEEVAEAPEIKQLLMRKLQDLLENAIGNAGGVVEEPIDDFYNSIDDEIFEALKPHAERIIKEKGIMQNYSEYDHDNPINIEEERKRNMETAERLKALIANTQNMERR